MASDSDMEEYLATQSQLLSKQEWVLPEGQVEVVVRPSIAIGVKGSGYWGTFGCFLKKGEILFGLTNSHVVGQKPNVEIAVAGKTYVIGKAKSGALRSPGAGIDAAIIDIDPDILSSKKNYSIEFPDKTYVDGPKRAAVGMEVWFWGAKTGRKRQGKITDVDAMKTISKTKWGHLIEFQCPGGGPIGGDSGSVLVNDVNAVVGLVFAGNGLNTGYACHIDTVLEALSKKYKGKFTFPPED